MIIASINLVHVIECISDYHTHIVVTALPRVLRYAFKALYQTLGLLWTALVSTKKASHVLVQVRVEGDC